jgi:hypothetical protein
MGLSCGNPTVLASLREGEVVVDLVSGAGLDVLVAARKVGHEQGVRCVHLEALLLRMLATPLRWDVADRTSIIFSRAFWTPSPVTSLLRETCWPVRRILSISSM